MPSKKKQPASNKRTTLPRLTDYAKHFIKDWERLSSSGRYDMNRLKEVMLLLIRNGEPLGPEWLDHPLKGSWEGYRECHIGGDFLLVYRLDNTTSPNSVVFVRTGTHADLFGQIQILTIAQKDKEIECLHKEIARLEEIIGLLRERKVV